MVVFCLHNLSLSPINLLYSEDEFAVPRLSKQAQKEITQQLIKDGYNLDLEPDDEDLDLIPPRPVHERRVCCSTPYACSGEHCSVQ